MLERRRDGSADPVTPDLSEEPLPPRWMLSPTLEMGESEHLREGLPEDPELLLPLELEGFPCADELRCLEEQGDAIGEDLWATLVEVLQPLEGTTGQAEAGSQDPPTSEEEAERSAFNACHRPGTGAASVT